MSVSIYFKVGGMNVLEINNHTNVMKEHMNKLVIKSKNGYVQHIYISKTINVYWMKQYRKSSIMIHS